MNINQWGVRWQLPTEAIAELQEILTAPSFPEKISGSGSEGAVQADIRLKASQEGRRLWRNNRGAVTTDDGRHIRFGLANDSAKMDKAVKSSDLIGITPVYISPEHVGRILGVFTSVEVKAPGWVYKNTPREQAQLAWLQAIVSLGGFATFASHPSHLDILK